MAYVATRWHHLGLTVKILAEILLPSTNWTAWDNRCEVKKNANQFLISFYPLLSSLVVSPITFEVSIDMIDGKEQREIRLINSIFAEFFGRIMCSDWLPDRARWTYLDRSAVFNYSPKESIFFRPHNRTFSVKLLALLLLLLFCVFMHLYPAILTTG